MGKYVLLHFPDERQADTLVEDMEREPEADILTPIQENYVHADLVAAFHNGTLEVTNGEVRIARVS